MRGRPIGSLSETSGGVPSIAGRIRAVLSQAERPLDTGDIHRALLTDGGTYTDAGTVGRILYAMCGGKLQQVRYDAEREGYALTEAFRARMQAEVAQ